jgi:hypothetical protein
VCNPSSSSPSREHSPEEDSYSLVKRDKLDIAQSTKLFQYLPPFFAAIHVKPEVVASKVDGQIF